MQNEPVPDAPDAGALQEAEAAPPAASATLPAEADPLLKAETEAREHYDAWLRAKAETDNVRKRAQAEIAAAHKFAVENFSAELLAVKDSLEAALAAENATVDGMRSGAELTLKQLNSAFEKFNLAEIDPLGAKFDPRRHQAIGTVDSEAEPNTVVRVLQKGYLLHDRVIRPALVTVARPKGVEN
ncbi:MAG: nucleotide exchange factor GrpE [Betaproteobacteria bacterium]|nr:nucleotide exchange factor GrpE [Betaproteobacteria bacterium]